MITNPQVLPEYLGIMHSGLQLGSQPSYMKGNSVLFYGFKPDFGPFETYMGDPTLI